jgi:hypothetical protein
MSLTLLTLTGDRPDQFALCERYMERQTSSYSEWIVVDDGHVPTRTTMHQTVIRLPPGKPPAESFLANLKAGLHVVQTENVAFIEDDDWYSPLWLWFVEEALMRACVIGERPSLYYNLTDRIWRDMRNMRHCSLCQTACRTSVAQYAFDSHERGTAFDLSLWASAASRWSAMHSTPMVVGLKGHKTGRAGIGVGHRPRGPEWVPDPDGVKLVELIGKDAENY